MLCSVAWTLHANYKSPDEYRFACMCAHWYQMTCTCAGLSAATSSLLRRPSWGCVQSILLHLIGKCKQDYATSSITLIFSELDQYFARYIVATWLECTFCATPHCGRIGELHTLEIKCSCQRLVATIHCNLHPTPNTLWSAKESLYMYYE